MPTGILCKAAQARTSFSVSAKQQVFTAHTVLLGLVDEGIAYTGPAILMDVALQTHHPFWSEQIQDVSPSPRTLKSPGHRPLHVVAVSDTELHTNPQPKHMQFVAVSGQELHTNSQTAHMQLEAVSDKELHTNSQTAHMQRIAVSDKKLHTNSQPDHMQLVAVSNKSFIPTHSHITCSFMLSATRSFTLTHSQTICSVKYANAARLSGGQ